MSSTSLKRRPAYHRIRQFAAINEKRAYPASDHPRIVRNFCRRCTNSPLGRGGCEEEANGAGEKGSQVISLRLSAAYEKFNGISRFENCFAGKVTSYRSLVATWGPVSRSKTMAFTWINLRGMKLDPVFTCSSAKAGNEKFAGNDENCVGTELFQSPVAGTSGLSWLIPKLDTRGSKKTRRRPVLHDSGQQ